MFDPAGEQEQNPDDGPDDGPGDGGSGGASSGTEASAALVAAARAVAATPAGELSDPQTFGVLDDLETARRAMDATTCELVSEIDFRGLTMARFGLGTPAALGRLHGWPASRAKQALRVGRRLRSFDEVDGALRHGRINLDHADVICRAANPRVEDVIAGAQEELVGLAAGVRFERFAKDVAGLAALADQDGGHDPRPDENKLSAVDDDFGSLVLRGTFVGDDAASLREALAERADQLFRAHKKDRTHCSELPAPSRAQLMAEALVDLVRRGRAAGATKGPVVDVTLLLPAPGDPGRRGSALQADRSGAVDAAGHSYPTHTIDLLCCDARYHPLQLSATGVPLDLGPAVRLADANQRRAAAARDGGCTFPGCDAPPSWTELHHVTHHGPDGPTDMWNLASLCRRHHGLVHRKGWGMEHDADQWFVFTTPAGERIGSQRHGRQQE